MVFSHEQDWVWDGFTDESIAKILKCLIAHDRIISVENEDKEDWMIKKLEVLEAGLRKDEYLAYKFLIVLSCEYDVRYIGI